MSETNGDLVSEIEPCSNHREKSPTQNAVSETKVSETWSPKQKSRRPWRVSPRRVRPRRVTMALRALLKSLNKLQVSNTVVNSS